ncbi:alpha/beta fold hydrolase [Parapedomonas caeni]
MSASEIAPDASPTPRSLTCRLPDGDMHALAFGDPARPVDLLFVHATGFNAATYSQLLAPLGEEHHVVALDMRGHGRTRLPTRPDRLRDWLLYARDVAAAAAALVTAGRPPVFAGHSMGAVVALQALAAQPRLGRGLLLLDPVLMPESVRWGTRLPGLRQLMRRGNPMAQAAIRRRAIFPDAEAVTASYRGRGAFRTWQPGFLEDYVAGGLITLPDGSVRLACDPAWEAATYAAHGDDRLAALRRIGVPVRILAAEHGSTAGRAVRSRDRLGPHVHLSVVPGGTHFFPMEQPGLVRDALRQLLAESAGAQVV